MKNPFKIIACDLGPNIFFEDVLLSLKEAVLPRKEGQETKKLETFFADRFGEATSFNSGRSAFLAILKSLDLQEDAGVLVQAYTCVAVPDVVLWAGHKPIFVDVGDDFNIDPKDLEKKITAKTKVLVIQHTFGIPAKLEKILKIAKYHKLFVIEDCAHATGLKFKNKLLGTFGDAAFFSFGRDKMISSVFGGMTVTKDKELALKIKNFQNSLDFPNTFWILKQLIYNPLIYLVVQTYNFFYFGKVTHFLAKKLNLLSKAVEAIEKEGGKPDYFPKKMPSSLSSLALLQLKRLDEFNSSRQMASNFYADQLKDLSLAHPPKGFPSLRYTIVTEERDSIKKFMERFGVYLDTWYDNPVAPQDTDLRVIGYEIGSCPMSEKLAQKSLNLPTNPNLSEEEIQYVANLLQKYYAS